MTFQQLIDNNRFQVSELLRQHHITYTNTQDGIRKAFDMHGDAFGIKLINILSKGNGSKTSNASTDTSDPNFIGPPVDTSGITGSDTSSSSDSGAFSLWGQLLSYVGKTGTTYQDFMGKINGTSSTSTSTTPANNLTWLYVGGGILALVVILILLFSKK